jgi:hypothetical protein
MIPTPEYIEDNLVDYIVSFNIYFKDSNDHKDAIKCLCYASNIEIDDAEFDILYPIFETYINEIKKLKN